MIKKITISTAEPERKVMEYLEIESIEKAIAFVQHQVTYKMSVKLTVTYSYEPFHTRTILKSENESAENLLHQMYNITFADPVGTI